MGNPAAPDGGGARPRVEISIVVPCRNEAENVPELAERAQAMFEAHGLAGEIVFVNDASTDHTGALIDELASRHDFVRAVHHPVNRGIPGGWESGLHASRGRYVAIMDGDLQNLPEDVYRLYRELTYSNADIVQGYRSHIGRARDFRYAMSRVLHYMLRLLFGIRLFDIKSGFLICERDIFAHILRRRFSYHYFQTFIVVSAHHKGYRIAEIESLFEERKLGESFIEALPLKMISKNLVDLVKGFAEFRLLSARTDTFADFLAHHPPTRPPAVLPLPRRLYLRAFAILMPLHHWKLSHAALRYFYQLRRTQWLTQEQIATLQDARLRALLTQAYRHVPYYREMLNRRRIDPREIRTAADLARLPVLTREAIHRNLHFDLMSDVHNKLQMLPVTATGATGEPLMLYADRRQLEMRWATALRNLEWTGYRFGDRQARLWHTAFGVAGRQAVRERIDAWLTRRAILSASVMNAASVGQAMAMIRRLRPAVIDADAEALEILARYVVQQGADLPRPKAVVSGEQTLTADGRALVEQAFGAKLFDRYESRVFSAIAHECGAQAGHHVNAESYIVEIVVDGRPARPGEVGDLLITDLTNLCVPIIRFAIGDRAMASDQQCPCGRGLPLIGAIEGRPAATVVGANGSVVPGTFFAHALKDYGHLIRQFQVVQEQPGALELRVVKGPRFSEPSLERLLSELRAHLGSDVTISVRYVDHIDVAAPGTPSTRGSTLALAADLFGGDGRDGNAGPRERDEALSSRP